MWYEFYANFNKLTKKLVFFFIAGVAYRLWQYQKIRTFFIVVLLLVSNGSMPWLHSPILSFEIAEVSESEKSHPKKSDGMYVFIRSDFFGRDFFAYQPKDAHQNIVGGTRTRRPMCRPTCSRSSNNTSEARTTKIGACSHGLTSIYWRNKQVKFTRAKKIDLYWKKF